MFRDSPLVAELALDLGLDVVQLHGDENACHLAELRRALPGRVVAIGDAGARVLGKAGFTVCSIRPEHGRLVTCQPTTAAPGLTPRSPELIELPVLVTVVPASNAKDAAEPRGTGVAAA